MLPFASFVDWTAGPGLWVVCAAFLYWLGGRHPQRDPQAADRWRTVSFVLGLLAILAALDSPIDALAIKLFWVHMVQHILLIAVAPPLLALARPWTRMWRGLPLEFRRRTARALTQEPRWRPLRRAWALIAKPLPSWLIFNLTFLAWHLPVAYDATLRSPAAHLLEHGMFFATALLFWSRVIYSPPWRSPLSDPGRIIYLGSTLVAGWVLAIVLALSTSPLYAAYADQASRPGGISALADQQLAAGIMWVPGSLSYTIAIVLIAYRWLEPRGPRARTGVRAIARSA